MTYDYSVADSGYFPFPVGENNPASSNSKVININGDLSNLKQIAAAFTIKGEATLRIADPFSGCAKFINLLAQELRKPVSVWANELVENRYKEAKEMFFKSNPDNIMKGSAHALDYKPQSMGLTWLNPPYQKDSMSGERTEVTAMSLSGLTMMGGYTLVAVYAHQLADALNGPPLLNRIWTWHDSVDIYRVPGKHLDRYTQVVLICHRSTHHFRVEKAKEMHEYLRAERLKDDTWSFLKSLTVLPEGKYEIDTTKQAADLPKSPFVWSQKEVTPAEKIRLWGEYSPFKSPNKLREFLSVIVPDGTITTAMALRGRQITAMLTNGAFNGMRIEGAKGVGYIRAVNRQTDSEPKVEIRRNEQGEETSRVAKSIRKVRTQIIVLYETGEVDYLENDEDIESFMDNHMEDFEKHSDKVFRPNYNFDFIGGTRLHNFRDGLLFPFFQEIRVKGKSLLKAQAHLIAGTVVNALIHQRPIVWAEQGYGKTVMACATLHILWRLSQIMWGVKFDADSPTGKALANPEWKAKCDAFIKKYRKFLMKPGMFSIVVAPPHIINQTEKSGKHKDEEAQESKWMREAKDTLPWAHIALIKSIDDMAKFAGNVRGDVQRKLEGSPNDLHVALIARTSLKDGEAWEPAYMHRTRFQFDEKLQARVPYQVMASADTGVVLEQFNSEGLSTPLRKGDVEKAQWWVTSGEVQKNPRGKDSKKMPSRPPGLKLKVKDGEIVRGKDGKPEYLYPQKFGLQYSGLAGMCTRTDASKLVPHWGAFPCWQMTRSHTALKNDPRDTPDDAAVTALKARFNLSLNEEIELRDRELRKLRMVYFKDFMGNLAMAQPLSDTAIKRLKEYASEVVKRFRLFPFPESFLESGWEKRDNRTPPKSLRFNKRNPKMPIGEFIRKKYLDMLYTACFDEVHEYAGLTIQGEMLSIISETAKITIGYTGTFFKGKASDARRLAHVFNRLMHQLYPLRERGSNDAWIDDMGVWEIRTTRSSYEDRSTNYKTTGTKKSSEKTTKTEKPGITPLLLRVFIGQFITGHMLDHVSSLPGYKEEVHEVDMDEDVASIYAKHIMGQVTQMKEVLPQMALISEMAGVSPMTQVMDKMIAPMVAEVEYDDSDTIRGHVNSCIKDGDTSVLASFYQAAMRLPDFPFEPYTFTHNAFEDDKDGYKQKGTPFTIHIPSLGSDRLYAKEKAVLDFIEAQLALERGVGLYISNTGEKSDLQTRYVNLLIDRFPKIPKNILLASLRASLDTTKREQFIGGLKCHVLVTNPALVATGVNLYKYPTLVFAQTPNQLVTMEQAARRAWRLGQTMDCITAWFVYKGTYQFEGLQNMKRKAQGAAFLHGRPGSTLSGFLQSAENDSEAEQMKDFLAGKAKKLKSAEDLFMTIEGQRLFEEDEFALPPVSVSISAVNKSEESKVLRLMENEPQEVQKAVNIVKGKVVKPTGQVVQLQFDWD